MRHWYRVLFYSLIPALILLMQMAVIDNPSDAVTFFAALIILYIPIAAITAFVLLFKHKRNIKKMPSA